MSRTDKLVAVVTGGSRGIGKGIARALAERGTTVYIAGRSQAGRIHTSPGELSAAEWRALRSQFVTSKLGRGGRRYAPYAFTEQGVAMLSSVLNSDHAIAVNIEIMRTFVRIRNLLATNKAIARRFERLERKFASHDHAIVGILSAIRGLMTPTHAKRRGIGFTANLGD
jgi:NAD(P)-dependent dehydrogenase (short-subunit alcohol dehydrogenase family)